MKDLLGNKFADEQSAQMQMCPAASTFDSQRDLRFCHTLLESSNISTGRIGKKKFEKFESFVCIQTIESRLRSFAQLGCVRVEGKQRRFATRKATGCAISAGTMVAALKVLLQVLSPQTQALQSLTYLSLPQKLAFVGET